MNNLPYLDDCIDGDMIHEYYRVRDSNVVVKLSGENRSEFELAVNGGQWLVAPTLAARAEFYGRARDSQSIRELAQWIRDNIKELDE